MATESRVIVHMVASLDGFIARKDGAVDWMETSDQFEGGKSMDAEAVKDFLSTVGCYVMGSHTYETALGFEAQGFGWAYGETPVFVLTTRNLPCTRKTVEFYSGDLTRFVEDRLKGSFASIWFAGGGSVAGACLNLRLADEVRYSVLPVLIGDGIRFFDRLQRDVSLHLREVTPYKNGMVELHYDVRHQTETALKNEGER